MNITESFETTARITVLFVCRHCQTEAEEEGRLQAVDDRSPTWAPLAFPTNWRVARLPGAGSAVGHRRRFSMWAICPKCSEQPEQERAPRLDTWEGLEQRRAASS